MYKCKSCNSEYEAAGMCCGAELEEKCDTCSQVISVCQCDSASAESKLPQESEEKCACCGGPKGQCSCSC